MDNISAKYKVNYYGQDVPVAENLYGLWSGIINGETLMLNVYSDEAVLISGTILSISHPMLGKIKGLYPSGLDYTLVLDDYSQLELNAEETRGLIYDKELTLDPDIFDIVIFRPHVTDIPYKHAFSGLTNEEMRVVREYKDQRIKTKLRII